MRTIGVITVARSDYGYYLPILRQIQSDPDLRLHLIVGGGHLLPQYGMTIRDIERDGFPIGDRVEMLLSSDTPEAIAKSIGLGVIGFSQSYARVRPDLLLALGDRFEMLAAVSAALPFKIPVAHLHGGESTEGVIDEAIRHALTKMSHLHFVSTEFYAQRVRQMGEESWRVTVSGAPTLDNLRHFTPLSRETLEERFSLHLNDPSLLVTYHPVTLEYEQTKDQVEELLAALEKTGMTVIFTYPNADTSNRKIIEKLHGFTAQHRKASLFTHLGTEAYFSLMKYVAALVGNSSSGIIEAASFKLPVVNIGNRQKGRLHGKNVVDVPCHRKDILDAIQRATSPEFRESLASLINPYGDGHATECIVGKLKEVEIDGRLLMKRFQDLGKT